MLREGISQADAKIRELEELIGVLENEKANALAESRRKQRKDQILERTRKT